MSTSKLFDLRILKFDTYLWGMRVYYLDVPLTPDEVRELEGLTGWQVELTRIPCLLPEARSLSDDQQVPVGPLKAAGILRDYGQRCALVQLTTDTVYWTNQFAEAIGRMTGRWPYLVQTEKSMEAIGTSDELRVIDLDKAMRD